MSEYRHEYKYVIDAVQEEMLLMMARGILKPDSNASADGRYIIRSLYFDDINDSFFYENLDGVDIRSKFRIRYYNGDTSFIRLEKKSKVHGMTRKKSCKLSAAEVELIVQGSRVAFDSDRAVLLSEFYQKSLFPKTIVTYERIPFIYSAGNVRITFDRNITSSTEVRRFITGDYRQRPILPLGSSVLEVKWDEVLPLHIKEMLCACSLQWSSFSKYAGCRAINL